MASTLNETDPLDHLEERIQKTVAVVQRLREEKSVLQREKEASENEANIRIANLQKEAADAKQAAAAELADVKSAAAKALEESRAETDRLAADLEAMRQERQQVRGRLEKLLGHIDQLGAA